MANGVNSRGAGLLAGVSVLVFAALLLAGCSDPNAAEDAATQRPPAPPTAARCPADGAEMAMGVNPRAVPVPTGSVPAGFEPATVMLCQALDLQSRGTPKIRYTMSTQEAPVTDPLLAAINLPNQQMVNPDRATCSLEFTALPYLLLLDRQRHAIRPAIPVDPCDKIRDEVSQAIAGLSKRETRHVVVDDIYIGR